MQTVIAKILIAVLISAAAIASPAPEYPRAYAPAGIANDSLRPVQDGSSYNYVLNTNTRKFHRPTCQHVDDIAPKNRINTSASRDEIIARGYVPCKRCNP